MAIGSVSVGIGACCGSTSKTQNCRKVRLRCTQDDARDESCMSRQLHAASQSSTPTLSAQRLAETVGVLDWQLS